MPLQTEHTSRVACSRQEVTLSYPTSALAREVILQHSVAVSLALARLTAPASRNGDMQLFRQEALTLPARHRRLRWM